MSIKAMGKILAQWARTDQLRRTFRESFLGLALLIAPAHAADDVLVRNMDTVLDFVGITSANCVQRYEEGITPKALAQLQFSQAEIASYCVCSTKLLVGEMEDTDFQELAKGNDLPTRFAPVLKRARFNCAKKVWEAKQHLKESSIDTVKRLMDEAKNQANSDLNGIRGQQARRSCSQQLQVSTSVANAHDVLRLYYKQNATAWTVCILETMYPDPTKR